MKADAGMHIVSTTQHVLFEIWSEEFTQWNRASSGTTKPLARLYEPSQRLNLFLTPAPPTL